MEDAPMRPTRPRPSRRSALEKICCALLLAIPLCMAPGHSARAEDRAEEEICPGEGVVPEDPGSDPGTGVLLRQTAEGLVPLPSLEMSVDLQVTGIMVRGRVEQVFSNPTSEVIEALYLFPLPEGAAVDSMEMRIGERRIRSVLKEREPAKAAYDAAKKEGKKAGLVEKRRSRLFRTSVANINPGERVEVRLEYVDEVTWDAGRMSLAFPLTWTPRFT